ncbi:MAG: cbb3-type cytochrome oxidase assembly protein CcoS [Burkholderiaceae bacterium]|nr:cbb3-type cytochrome oxidase assembly protein CcoS [Burkholderiaceae bacterium]
MEALYLLIPLSLGIIVLAAWIFLRMSASGQFDDMDAPAHSILVDDDRPAPTQITPKSEAPGPQDPASSGTPDAAGRH